MPYNTIHHTATIPVPLSAFVPVPVTLHEHIQFGSDFFLIYTHLTHDKDFISKPGSVCLDRKVASRDEPKLQTDSSPPQW